METQQQQKNKLQKIVDILQNKKHINNKEVWQELEGLLLSKLVHLSNITKKSKQFGGDQLLYKFIENIDLQVLEYKDYIGHDKQKCSEVFIILSGEVIGWEKKDEQSIAQEMDLNKKLKHFQTVIQQSEKDDEITYFQKKIDQIESKLELYRSKKYDQMLLHGEKRYQIISNIFSHKKQSLLRQNDFIGEKEAVSEYKFDKTYQVLSEKCYVLKMEAKKFVKIFQLQLKKVEFIYDILENNFPNANQESLRWLSYQAQDEFFNLDQIIFDQGSEIDKIYVIREGEVQFEQNFNYIPEQKSQKQISNYDKKIEIQKLSEGHFFGFENMYKKNGTRSYKVISKSTPFVLLYSITKKQINKIIIDYEDENLKNDLIKISKVKDTWLEKQAEKIQEFNKQQLEQKVIRRESLLNSITQFNQQQQIQMAENTQFQNKLKVQNSLQLNIQNSNINNSQNTINNSGHLKSSSMSPVKTSYKMENSKNQQANNFQYKNNNKNINNNNSTTNTINFNTNTTNIQNKINSNNNINNESMDQYQKLLNKLQPVQTKEQIIQKKKINNKQSLRRESLRQSLDQQMFNRASPVKRQETVSIMENSRTTDNFSLNQEIKSVSNLSPIKPSHKQKFDQKHRFSIQMDLSFQIQEVSSPTNIKTKRFQLQNSKQQPQQQQQSSQFLQLSNQNNQNNNNIFGMQNSFGVIMEKSSKVYQKNDSKEGVEKKSKNDISSEDDSDDYEESEDLSESHNVVKKDKNNENYNNEIKIFNGNDKNKNNKKNTEEYSEQRLKPIYSTFYNNKSNISNLYSESSPFKNSKIKNNSNSSININKSNSKINNNNKNNNNFNNNTNNSIQSSPQKNQSLKKKFGKNNVQEIEQITNIRDQLQQNIFQNNNIEPSQKHYITDDLSERVLQQQIFEEQMYSARKSKDVSGSTNLQDLVGSQLLKRYINKKNEDLQQNSNIHINSIKKNLFQVENDGNVSIGMQNQNQSQNQSQSQSIIQNSQIYQQNSIIINRNSFQYQDDDQNFNKKNNFKQYFKKINSSNSQQDISFLTKVSFSNLENSSNQNINIFKTSNNQNIQQKLLKLNSKISSDNKNSNNNNSYNLKQQQNLPTISSFTERKYIGMSQNVSPVSKNMNITMQKGFLSNRQSISPQKKKMYINNNNSNINMSILNETENEDLQQNESEMQRKINLLQNNSYGYLKLQQNQNQQQQQQQFRKENDNRSNSLKQRAIVKNSKNQQVSVLKSLKNSQLLKNIQKQDQKVDINKDIDELTFQEKQKLAQFNRKFKTNYNKSQGGFFRKSFDIQKVINSDKKLSLNDQNNSNNFKNFQNLHGKSLFVQQLDQIMLSQQDKQEQEILNKQQQKNLHLFKLNLPDMQKNEKNKNKSYTQRLMNRKINSNLKCISKKKFENNQN